MLHTWIAPSAHVAKSLFVNPEDKAMSNLQANIDYNITIVLNT